MRFRILKFIFFFEFIPKKIGCDLIILLADVYVAWSYQIFKILLSLRPLKKEKVPIIAFYFFSMEIIGKRKLPYICFLTY